MVVFRDMICVKCDPEPFSAVWNRRKNFDVRRNDRDYRAGDTLRLDETVHSREEMNAGKPLAYTGRVIVKTIIYVMRGPCYGLEAGWVILGFE